MACFLHGLPDHQHLTSHRYLVGSPGGQFTVTSNARPPGDIGVSQHTGKVIVTTSGGQSFMYSGEPQTATTIPTSHPAVRTAVPAQRMDRFHSPGGVTDDGRDQPVVGGDTDGRMKSIDPMGWHCCAD